MFSPFTLVLLLLLGQGEHKEIEGKIQHSKTLSLSELFGVAIALEESSSRPGTRSKSSRAPFFFNPDRPRGFLKVHQGRRGSLLFDSLS